VSSEPLLGDPDDLRKILESVDARNESLDALTRGVDTLTAAVLALRGEIDRRPTAESQQHKRRQVVASLIVYGLLIIWGHDAHVEHCGPGSRAEAVIRAVAAQPVDAVEPLSLEQIQMIVEREQPTPLCDISFPFHAHDDSGFPTGWAVVGFGLYAAGGAGLYLWQRGPKRPPKGGRRSTDRPVEDS
jgi:hypothetical protein